MQITLRGLGTDSTTTAGFTDGLKLWTTPSTAMTATTSIFSNLSTSFSGSALPYTAGVLAVPAIGAILLLNFLGGRRRRRR